MATIIKKNDKMLGTGRLTGKYIARPVVTVRPRVYNAPSVEGSMEYNLLKKEFSLFEGFEKRQLLKKLDAFDRVLKKAATLRAETRRVLANKIVVPGKSWAHVVKKGPCKPNPVVVVSLKRHDWSRAKARQDYTRAYNHMLLERENALKIVEGMAARRPIKVFPKQREHISLIKRENLREALKAFRKEKKQMSQPKQVEDFDFRCYYENTAPEVKEIKVLEPCYFTWGVCKTSQKQIKYRQARKEFDQNCQDERSLITLSKKERFSLLSHQLGRTLPGKMLMLCFLKWKLKKSGITQEEFKNIFSEMDGENVAEPQMDPEGVVGQVAQQTVQKSNTVIDNLNPVDHGEAVSVNEGFKDMAISRESQIFQSMVDRWILLGQVDWPSSIGHGQKLVLFDQLSDIGFPFSILKKISNSPNSQVFMVHRWARYSVKLRFCLNSNPFQIGSCVVSPLYLSDRENCSSWDNVYSALQRNHCKLNAGTSNDAEILIPYRFFNSMTSIRDKDDIGKLSIFVLNPLKAATTTATKCSISIYATFENTEFCGLISRGISMRAEPQMETIGTLLNVGSDLLRTINREPNRDNPPLPLQPVSLIPQATPSFAFTDGIQDPVNILRADPRGQTPHVDTNDEMNYLSICSKWGYVKTEDWTVGQKYGSPIFSMDVVPLHKSESYFTSVSSDNFGAKIYPPIAYVSSLYGRWRGDIEFKLEIFGSKFHTGRLMIGAVPYPGDADITISDLRYSAFKLFDLADSTEFIFRAPWIWKNASVPTYETTYEAPSKFYAFVSNPLIAIENVAQKVYVNIYIRAAPNFELFIPRPPVIVPRIGDPIRPPSTEYLKMYNTEDKVWCDWRGVLEWNDGVHYSNTTNIDSVAGGWQGTLDAKLGEYYELQALTTRNYRYRLMYQIVKGRLSPVEWAVYDPALTTKNARGLLICKDRAAALNAAKAFMNKQDPKVIRATYTYPWIEQGPAAEISIDGATWIPTTNISGNTPIWRVYEVDAAHATHNETSNDIPDFEVVVPQMDNVPVVYMQQPTASSSNGILIYGESTPDLKSLCRRYIHYGSVSAKTCILGLPRDCPYTACLAVTPMRHIEPVSSYSYDNRWRNGVLTTIGSMYRLWRGGLRFRFMVVGNPPEGTTLYIQHRYDYADPSGELIVSGPKKVRDRHDLMATQYATFAQALSVNSTCTIEVPYYSECEGLPVLPQMSSPKLINGSLLLWIHSRTDADIHLEVFYSFADDCRFSVFQGCPASIDLNSINAEPQMDNKPVESQGLWSSIKATVSAPKDIRDEVVKVSKPISEAATSLNKVAKSLSSMFSEIKTASDTASSPSFKEKIKNKMVKGGLSLITNELYELGSSAFDILTHMVYAVIAPTKKTICWAIFNIYKSVFGMSMDGFTQASSYIGKLWDKVKFSSQQPQRKRNAEPQGDDCVAGSYASLLFTSIATLCQLKVSPPTSWKGISTGLFAFSNSARSGSYVAKFIQDNLSFFKRVYEKFLGLFGVNSPNFKLIAGLDDSRMKEWLIQSDVVLAPQYEEKLVTDPSWSQKVFELAVVGRALERILVGDVTTPVRLLQLVRNNLVALKKIEKKLISRKVYSGARYEPSCVWVGGGAGTGKTYFLQELATELAKMHDFKGLQSYHSMTAGVKYFDAYCGQPMIIMDDFLSGPLFGTTDLGTQFLQLKSCNVFNMPKSAVEDKDQLLNFMDLGITSNCLFVDGVPGVHDESAYNRRRTVLLNFEFVKNVEKDGKLIAVNADNVKELFTREQMSNMEHLDVSYLKYVSNSQSPRIKIGNSANKREEVFKFVIDALKKYHDEESLNYKKRCDDIQKLVDNMDGSETFDNVLQKFRKSLSSYWVSHGLRDGLKMDDLYFKSWLSDSKSAATALADMVEPQGDSPFTWPKNTDERCTPLTNIGLIEPFNRDNMPPLEIPPSKCCLHELFDFEFANYDSDLNVFYSDRTLICDKAKHLAFSVNCGPCKINTNGNLEDLRTCSWLDKQGQQRFLNGYMFSPCIKGDLMRRIDVSRATSDWTLYEDCPQELITHMRATFESNETTEHNAKLIAIVCKEQRRLLESYRTVGDVAVPKKPKWKTICSAIWDTLIDVLMAIYMILGTLIMGGLVFCFFWGISQGKAAMEDQDSEIEAQMHPSGDFKTVRNSKTIRARSIRLVEGEGAELSSEKEIVDDCAQKRNNSGIYAKIVNNSFFLIGKVPSKDSSSFQIYKARCLGLYNKKFLVLKHYIDYFKNMNVTRVVVVYHEAKGAIEYDLKDLEFKWTEEGYGVGELPKSAPRQFANIVKFMPSEKFDMCYPRKLKVFEIWNDSVVEHSIDAQLFTSPLTVTGSKAEGSWTISQGFKYGWGGKGCCGSIVIAEDMACPLVGVHTAGLGETKGYAELLFKETFDNNSDIVLEYVVPNMAASENVFGLDGFYYQVGQLDPDMSVSGPVNSRITPSEVQGVFPVVSYPAPLSKNDPRLNEPLDIVKIGANKRCTPPKEFDRGDVQTAFLHFWKLIKKEVKPVRSSIAPLSIKESVEGFELPGYEPIEISTSEGYPWVNMRPKSASNKSWMFEFESYPNGRRKLVGINADLQRVLDLKMDMRKRGIVPNSYFTCCLKDARLLEDKIPEPGKTRLFEMCPVDLTIAYRQYNLDFTASFSAARLRAENSIGINCDGPEWTELANWLLEFSPHIITADYSAFGPRLNLSVLENACNITTEWYEFYDECSEEEHDRRYIVRECLREEIAHAPTIVKDLIFVPTCGMPSGFPDTVTKNSKVNSQYIRIAYMNLAAKHAPEFQTLHWFSDHVRLVTNGDDLIAAVKPEIIEWFNNETLIDFFKGYDIKMTDAMKSGKVRPYCSLEEATYLKRGFCKHPTRKGQWLAPLDKNSISDTANWVWKSVNLREASLVNSESCCRNAYSQGPKYYNYICKTIAKKWLEYDVIFEYPSWELLDNHVWDNAPGPKFCF